MGVVVEAEDRSFMDDYLLKVLGEKDELGLRVDDLEKEVREKLVADCREISEIGRARSRKKRKMKIIQKEREKKGGREREEIKLTYPQNSRVEKDLPTSSHCSSPSPHAHTRTHTQRKK